LLAGILVWSVCFTAIAQIEPIQVKKGEIAPCSGVLLTEDQFRLVVQALEEVKLLRMKVSMLESIEKVVRGQAIVYKEAYEAAEKLAPKDHWYNSKLLWFTIGIATSRLLMTEDSK